MRDPSPLAAGTTERYASLRAHAARKKQETVDRLTAAITEIRNSGDPVTEFTIKRACGLDATTIKRNNEAYQLFARESDYLRTKRQKEEEGQRRRHRKRSGAPATASPAHPPCPHDPLLDSSKAPLAALAHALQAD